MLENYDVGTPCMLGEAVVRISGDSPNGTYAEMEGKKVCSIVMVRTPHGTVIETGIFHLNEITKEGMKRLLDYEQELSNG